MEHEELPFCECGDCGLRVTKPGNRFIIGHNNRGVTKETCSSVAAQAEKLRGRTKETHPGVAAQAAKMRGRTKENDIVVAARAEVLRGRTKENHPGVARMAETLRGRKRGPHSEKTKEKMRGPRVPREVRTCAYPNCDNTFEVVVAEWDSRKYCSIKCYWEDMKGRTSCNKNRKHSEEFRKYRSTSQQKLWQDLEYREKQLKAIIKGSHIRPTTPEKFLIGLFQKLFLAQWKYAGDGKDEDAIIGGRCPDFISIDGQKKIIELFGDYWHGEERTGIPSKQHERERINYFAQYGYQTLVIWEHELENIDNVIDRIEVFA